MGVVREMLESDFDGTEIWGLRKIGEMKSWDRYCLLFCRKPWPSHGDNTKTVDIPNNWLQLLQGWEF